MCTFRFNTLEQFCHICGFSMTRKLLGNPLLHVQRPTQLSCPPSAAGRELLHPTPLPRIGCAKEGGEQQELTACVELCGLPAPQLPLCHCCDASPAMDLLQMESQRGRRRWEVRIEKGCGRRHRKKVCPLTDRALLSRVLQQSCSFLEPSSSHTASLATPVGSWFYSWSGVFLDDMLMRSAWCSCLLFLLDNREKKYHL